MHIVAGTSVSLLVGLDSDSVLNTHFIQSHRLGWACPFECDTFPSGKEVMEHFQLEHPGRLHEM